MVVSQAQRVLNNFRNIWRTRLWPPSAPDFLYTVDRPDTHGSRENGYVPIRGWIAAPEGATIADIHIVSEGREARLIEVVRPDVCAAYPAMVSIGFQGVFPAHWVKPGRPCLIRFRLNRSLRSFPADPLAWLASTVTSNTGRLGLTARIKARLRHPVIKSFLAMLRQMSGHAREKLRFIVDLEFRAQKRRKLNRIVDVLQCPSCRGSLDIAKNEEHLRCVSCGTDYAGSAGRNFNFLSEELRTYGAVRPTENVSAWPYDPMGQQIIEELKDGLILDNGCGLRENYLENVVFFEIVDYPSTDVLGIGEKLPFKDNSFDAVFSMMVLEHVKRPFECASEILRVLKPGGKLYVVAPFLQPFHGYPDHYYNMTSTGLRNLFPEAIEVVSSGVPQWGSPVFALNWILNSYVKGLPEDLRESFTQMRVSDFLEHPSAYLDAGFVTRLSPEANEELACTNYILGRKSR